MEKNKLDMTRPELIGYTDRLEEVNAKLVEALEQLIDRLDYHGDIDAVREEGPIEDARAAIAKAKGE